MVSEKILEDIVSKIRSKLGEDVDFIVLFGSVATGHSHPLSDIDIGVKISNHEEELVKIFADLLSLFDAVDDRKHKVDVSLLNLGNLTLLYRVVRDGQILYQRNEEVWPCFVEYILGRYPDWKFFIENYLEQSLGV